MNKRNIGKEIIAGLEELKAWRRGEVKLKTHVVEMPTAADVPAIRKELADAGILLEDSPQGTTWRRS